MINLQKNLRFLRLVTLASIGVTAMSAAVFAQDRKPDESVIVPGVRGGPACSLQLLNAVPLEINNDQLTVPADVNGKRQSFLFDTAALTNQMTDAAARSLGLNASTRNYGGPRITGNVQEAFAQSTTSGGVLPVTRFDSLSGNRDSAELEIYDSKGMSYNSIATVADFTMQAMEDKNVDFHISPLPPPGVDGVLNLDLFARFDIDLNFAARSMNFFSKDHCKGQILYWRAPGVAALPFVTRDSRIVTHVTLEGKELTAVIDTGSPISALRFDAAARAFGITPDAPGLTLVGEHHDNARQDIYAYNFKTLSFGTVAIGNARLMLTRDTVLVKGADPNAPTGSLLRHTSDDVQPDMIIGMDLLKLTHLYIALGERVLYVTQGPELDPGAAGAQPAVPVTPFRP